MTFEEALAQTMSIAALLDVGGCRILDTTASRPCLVMRSASRPLSSSRRAEQLVHGLACCSAFEVRRQLHTAIVAL